MSRDERPYFDNELGIPWDEAQFACWLAVEGGIKQAAHGPVRQRSNSVWFLRLAKRAELALWFELWDVDGQAAKFARRTSTRLRDHPSHKARR